MCNLFYIVCRCIYVLHVKPQGGYYRFSINEIVQHFPVHKSVLVCLYNFVRLAKNVVLKTTLLFLSLSSLSLSLVRLWSSDFKFVRRLFWALSEKLTNFMQDTRLLKNEIHEYSGKTYLISTTKIPIYSIFTVHLQTALDISNPHEQAPKSFLSLKPRNVK